MSIKLLDGRLVINLIFIPVAIVMACINGAASVAAFFAALFLHECAHSIMASALGVRVSSLELMPFGCTAHVESFAVINGSKEIAMAAAGPAVNILTAAACYVALRVAEPSAFLEAFFRSNVMLAAMNLLPALPLDGGRILASVLSISMPPLRATRLTSILGICVGSLLLGVGIYMAATGNFNPTILLMSSFMLYASIRHFKNAAYMFLKNTTGKRDAIRRRTTVDVKNLAVHKSRTMGEVLPDLDTRKYNMVYVLDDDLRVIGRLSESELLRGVVKEGTAAPMQALTREK